MYGCETCDVHKLIQTIALLSTQIRHSSTCKSLLSFIKLLVHVTDITDSLLLSHPYMSVLEQTCHSSFSISLYHILVYLITLSHLNRLYSVGRSKKYGCELQGNGYGPVWGTNTTARLRLEARTSFVQSRTANYCTTVLSTKFHIYKGKGFSMFLKLYFKRNEILIYSAQWDKMLRLLSWGIPWQQHVTPFIVLAT
jgi:hypothetical protein